MFNVLVVEDDPKINLLYCDFLVREGYTAVSAHNVAEALTALDESRVDLMLVDVMMPGVDGVGLVSMVRSFDKELPILMLTALGDLATKQRAFSAGADDYMVKPVDLNELSLRITALLRRAKVASERRLTIGAATLDYDTLTVTEGSSVQTLPPKEFQVLFKLCSNPGRIYTRRDIMDDVWGPESTSDERTVDVHVKRLRERFADSGSFEIDTVRGLGYKAVAK